MRRCGRRPATICSTAAASTRCEQARFPPVGTQLQPWRAGIAVGSHCFGCTAGADRQTDRNTTFLPTFQLQPWLTGRTERKKGNSVPTFSMRSSTSMPSITCPKMVYLPAAQHSGPSARAAAVTALARYGNTRAGCSNG